MQASGSPLETLLLLRSRASIEFGEDANHLAQWLMELHAPPSLAGFYRIACNTCTLLRLAIKTTPPEQSRLLKRSVRELRWVIAHAVELADALYDDPKDRERFLRVSGSNPLLGSGATQHGLWCLLWERHPVRRLQAVFGALQTQALLAHVAILRHWTASTDWQSESAVREGILVSLYQRTLALRHFAMARYLAVGEHDQALARIQAAINQDNCMTMLMQVRSEFRKAEVEPRQITRDLAALIGLLVWSRQPGRVRTIREDIDELDSAAAEVPESPNDEQGPLKIELDEVVCMDPLEDDEPEDDFTNDGQGANSTYAKRRWSKSEMMDLLESGVHPEEVLHTDVLSLSERNFVGPSAWLEMQHQLLPSAWSILATQELVEGFDLLGQAARKGGIMELAMLTFALTVFARGVTAAQAQAIVCCADPLERVEALTLLLPADGGSAAWLIPAVPIPYSVPDARAQTGCRPCNAYFSMPDYWRVGERMRALIRQVNPHWDGAPIVPFAAIAEATSGRDNLSARLKDTLCAEDADRAEHLATRFTLPRIAKALFQGAINVTGGDLVPATYLTMQTHPGGEVTRYYDSPSVRHLQRIERDVWQGLALEFAALQCNLIPDLTLSPTEDSGYIGSPLCPQTAALAAVIAQNRELVVDASKRMDVNVAIEDVILRHNAYTVYTYIGVTLGTSHRPAHDGVPALETIDVETGLAAVADKGAHKARLIPVADSALLQLRAYRAYLASFEWMRSIADDLPSRFFFLDEDAQPVPVSPATLKGKIPFVANFARHYLRTILAEWWYRGEKSLSPEQINALLGHAAAGEQPYGPYSSFDYCEFRKQSLEVLALILNDLDFYPISVDGARIFPGGIAIERIR